jgi:hypothetical protein
MAIDTKEKRAAVLGVARPWVRDKFPVAAKDEEWRISSGNAYGGNALTPTAYQEYQLLHPIETGMYRTGIQPIGSGV